MDTCAYSPMNGPTFAQCLLAIDFNLADGLAGKLILCINDKVCVLFSRYRRCNVEAFGSSVVLYICQNMC